MAGLNVDWEHNVVVKTSYLMRSCSEKCFSEFCRFTSIEEFTTLVQIQSLKISQLYGRLEGSLQAQSSGMMLLKNTNIEHHQVNILNKTS